MSDAVLIAAFILVAGGIGWLVKMHMDHLRECRKVQADNAQSIAMIIGTLERLVRDVGTHETGLRGQVHDMQTAILKMDGRLAQIEKQELQR